MIFTKAENEEYSLVRYISENNRWEIYLNPMLFGIRVRAGILNSPCLAIDYCLGSDPCEIHALFFVVLGILQSFPESATTDQVRRAMPIYKVKPITKDKECCAKLLKLLKETDKGNPLETHV